MLMMFLQAVSNLGYSDSKKLKKDFENLNKNPGIAKILEQLAVHLHQSNIVTADQQQIYDEIENSQLNFSSPDLLKVEKNELHQNKLLLQKGQFLQQNLDATKKRIASLQEQLRVLEKTNKQSSICEDELKDVIRHSVTIAEDSKEKHQTTVMQYLEACSSVKDDCEMVSSRYKDESKDSLISHIDLDAYFLSEDTYTIQITDYAKKQFHDVSLVLDNLTDFSCKLYSAADTILLGEEDQDVKNDLLDDLRRATLGYVARKKRSILAKANLEQSIAVNEFLKQERIVEKYASCMPSRSRIEHLKNSIDTTLDQSSYIMKSVLPNLLAKGEPELKNLFLTGDFKRKLEEQRQVRSKQSQMIELLHDQCSRFSLIWMLLQIERVQGDVLSKLMLKFYILLEADLKSIQTDTQILNTASPADNTNKDPKAVIDKRDQVMVNLHDLLVANTSSSTMFKTFESVQKAAEKLKESKASTYNLYQKVNQSFRKSLISLFNLYYDVTKDDGSILLRDSEIASQLEKLQSDVAQAKVSVSKLLVTVDKKRAFIGHNQAAAIKKKVWIPFVTKALETISENFD